MERPLLAELSSGYFPGVGAPPPMIPRNAHTTSGTQYGNRAHAVLPLHSISHQLFYDTGTRLAEARCGKECTARRE